LFVIIPSDKNLGPCILEYEEHIHRVFIDHLCDATTYEQLDEDAAKIAVDATYAHIDSFLITFGGSLPEMISSTSTAPSKVKTPLPTST
jgi:hypothetical protein